MKRQPFTPDSNAFDQATRMISNPDLVVQAKPALSEKLKLLRPDLPERRAFNRAQVDERKIELRFQSDIQLAKAYVHNISMGGLFVKTSAKRQMGEVLDIDLSHASQKAPWVLKARVVRVEEHGFALQFIDIPTETRIELESLVRSSLPSGIDLKAQMGRESSERLKNQREAAEQKKARIKRQSIKWAIAVLLALVNIAIGIDEWREQGPAAENPTLSAHAEWNLEGEKINPDDISSIVSNGQSEVLVQLKNGKQITLDSNTQLPGFWGRSLKLVKSLPKLPTKRTRQNTSSQTESQKF